MRLESLQKERFRRFDAATQPGLVPNAPRANLIYADWTKSHSDMGDLLVKLYTGDP